jgi:hypothetical protein
MTRSVDINRMIARGIAADTDECIIWPFAIDGAGYPNRLVPGSRKFIMVNRLICTAVKGPAPSEKHQAAHSCHTKRCINGTHLSWKTPLGNMLDNVIRDQQCRTSQS